MKVYQFVTLLLTVVLISGCSLLVSTQESFKNNAPIEPIVDSSEETDGDSLTQTNQTFEIQKTSNVRTEPSIEARILTVLAKGTSIHPIKEETTEGRVWYLIETNQGKGWISSAVLEEDSTIQVTELESSPTDGQTVNSANTIQTYQVSLVEHRIQVSGKATPYGKQNKAVGVIVDIHEQRSNQKTTIRIPFDEQNNILYVTEPTVSFGEVIINLDEYYEGVEDDPTKVLGHAIIKLDKGNPYLLPSYMVQSDNRDILALANQITASSSSDAEKSKAIFTWVAQHIQYDSDTFFSSENQWKNYSALETLHSRLAMCTGYANLNASLHRAIGLETKVVYGEKHAWNEVKINGVWQSQDPTYGAGVIDSNTHKFVPKFQLQYFTMTDKTKEGEYPW